MLLMSEGGDAIGKCQSSCFLSPMQERSALMLQYGTMWYGMNPSTTWRTNLLLCQAACPNKRGRSREKSYSSVQVVLLSRHLGYREEVWGRPDYYCADCCLSSYVSIHTYECVVGADYRWTLIPGRILYSSAHPVRFATGEHWVLVAGPGARGTFEGMRVDHLVLPELQSARQPDAEMD